MSSVFSSLKLRNYRIYFIGALVSNLGNWLSRTAISWLVLMELTDGSASALGLVTAIMFAPQLLLGPYAGAIADRFPKRRILMVTQAVFGFDVLLMSILVLSGTAELWMIYLICLNDGIWFSFDNPARQSFVSEVVPSRQLPNAIGLNSASFNAARLLGPGIAGLLIAAIGTGWVIGLDIFSYIAMFTSLALLDPSKLHPAPKAKGSGKTREGLRYITSRPDLMILLACGLAVGGLGFNFTITNAVMATEQFGRGAGEYGILGSAMGVGALAAALWAAGRLRPRVRQILFGMLGYVVFNLAAIYSPSYEFFAALQIPVGFATITVLVTANTLLQELTAPVMRGRVLSLWGLVIMGVTPAISPLIGWLGDTLGPRSTLWFGVIAVGVMLIFIYFAASRVHQVRLHFDVRRRHWITVDHLQRH